MMQVRCQRCGWTYTLNREAIGYAVAEVEAAQAAYYQENCPKCRNVVKIQVKDLRRRLPPDYVLPTLPPKPEPIRVPKDEQATTTSQPAATSPAANAELQPKRSEPPPPKPEPIRAPQPAKTTTARASTAASTAAGAKSKKPKPAGAKTPAKPSAKPKATPRAKATPARSPKKK